MSTITERLTDAARLYPIIEDQPYSLFVDSLAEIERLQARVAELYDLIKYAQVDSGVCMCGDDIKDHNQAIGHSPVDVWDHAVEQINKEGSSEAFILRKQAAAVEYEIISLCGDLRKSGYRGISVKELLHESVGRSSRIRNEAKKFDDQ